LRTAGLTVPNSNLDNFFEEVDTNNDGTISFEEWRYVPLSSHFTTTVLRVALEQAAPIVAEDHLWPTLAWPLESDMRTQLATISRICGAVIQSEGTILTS
jgi:hypothetical protein